MGCQSSKGPGDGAMYGVGEKPPGCRLQILKQDPSQNGGVAARITWLHEDIKQGPANDDIVTMGMDEEYAPNEEGDLMFDFEENPAGFDAAHTFAVVQQVLTIYRRALKRTKVPRSFNWQWGEGTPLRLLPHAGDMNHAFYNREYKTLAFFCFDDDSKGKTMFTCRSWDLVAHETGHAILDSLKPKWYNSTNPQTGALHEAFGDMTAIFLLLDQLDMCENIITRCKGDLHNRSLLLQIAEESGSTFDRKFGLQNAGHDQTIKDVPAEIHELSCLLTSAIIDILVGFYDGVKDFNKYSPAETLFRAAKRLCTSLVLAIIATPEENATFKDLAEKLLDVESKGPFKSVVKASFKRRCIFEKKGHPKEYEGDIAANACGTMKIATDEKLKETLFEALKVYLPEPVEEKPQEEEKEEKADEQKANGDATTEKEGGEAGEQEKEKEVEEEKKEVEKEAPKAEPEQVINGTASVEEIEVIQKMEEHVEHVQHIVKQEIREVMRVENGEVVEKEEIREESTITKTEAEITAE